MISTAVDHEHVIGELEFARRTVRKSEEYDVGRREVRGRGVGEGQVMQGTQVRVDSRERLTGVRVGRDDRHLELGVRRQQAQQFAACIAAGAGDGNGEWHRDNLRFDGMSWSRRRREGAVGQRSGVAESRRARRRRRAAVPRVSFRVRSTPRPYWLGVARV